MSVPNAYIVTTGAAHRREGETTNEYDDGEGGVAVFTMHDTNARILLRRADTLLEEAAGAPDHVERFLTAYVAALRGAGAALEIVDPTPKRGRSRSAWVRLGSAPGFDRWSAYFAGYSTVRAAVEAGARDRVGEAQVDEFFRQVGRFLHAVDDAVSAASVPVAIPA